MEHYYIIDGDIIADIAGKPEPFDLRKITRMMISATQPNIIYCTSEDTIISWIASMMSHGIMLSNGRKNSYNVLCGTNRILYHATYCNSEGVPTRMFLLSNLLRTTSALKLQQSYGGDTPIAAGIRALRSCVDLNISGMTIGGAAMAEYAKNGAQFAKNFPAMDQDAENDMRTGYLGGYIACKPGEYENVVDYDCNSMYSTQLRNKPLPYGKPVAYSGAYVTDEDMPRHIDVMTFRADAKRDGYAFLGVMDMLSGDRASSVTSTRGYITMALTDIDQQLLYDNYDVSVYKYERGWKFKAQRDMFTDYVDHWYALKSTSKGAQRNIAKLMLNSLVGKFGTVPRDSCLEPQWDDESHELLWSTRHVTPKNSRHYLPIAMFVNAYARQTLIAACRANSNVVSINTDGFAVVGDEVHGIDISPTRLGRWKIKARYKRLVILNTGCYQGETEDGRINLVCAGVSRSAPIPWEQFRHGGTFTDDYGQQIVLH